MSIALSPIDRVFHALGDPTRREMLEKLRTGPLSVTQLATPFSMSLAAIVQHIQVLEKSGLVVSEKAGRVRTCRIEPGAFTLPEKWISECKATWEHRLDRLGELLEEETDT